MTQQDNTVRTETSLRIAVKLMLKHRINCLPVVFEDEQLCRIVTSTNLPITLPKYIEQRQRNVLLVPQCPWANMIGHIHLSANCAEYEESRILNK